MTECPTCKLSMESHSTLELTECCMKQIDEDFTEDTNICPNCKHPIKGHLDKELVECILAFFRSNIRN